ncbi:MAG: RNase family beta-CASP ribonuclease [Frankiales bacterium]|nr:RNase family beta-CASP ribonuclease [Frankiales bacterium]
MTSAHTSLGAPPPLVDGGLRLVALGGIGEIGRNMMVYEYAGRLLIVDCGVLFPNAEQPGVDLILPDFRYISNRLDDVEAVILTHGHEDHIGAVPYLLRHRRDIPIVGSKLTLAFMQAKFNEHRLNPPMHEVVEGERRTYGPFDIEFIAVNHSIPDALAVAFRTGAGLVVHTGDFKMDQLPLDGRLTDLGAFYRLGQEGIDLLLSDSTNADVPGFVTSESEVGGVLDRVFGKARKRIIVACFASHVHRVQQALDAAYAHERQVAFIGRSMVRNMGIARDLGYLTIPAGLTMDAREIDSLPLEHQVLISTGSQGEPLAALSRMASGDHPVVIEEGDTVVLASSLIPGNEDAVFGVINGLIRLGANVVHKGTAAVHVSGHAPAGELLFLLNATRPSNVMPVHGEWRHLRAHAALAEQSGVPKENIVFAPDGVVVDLVDGKALIVGEVEVGFVFVDGSVVGDVTDASLKDRRILGEEGFISIVLAVDSNGMIITGPQISGRGFSDDEKFDAITPLLAEALEKAAANGEVDVRQMQQIVRRTVGKWVSDTYRRRPMIIPVVVEV